MANIIKINIYADPSQPNPTLSLPDVPWYAGITALQAMIIGEALHPSSFMFRVIYRSIYGAFIDSIDGLADEDQPNHYWMLYIDGDEAEVGASESILLEDANKTQVIIEWRYVDISGAAHTQAALKSRALP
ncbi:MAG: DUF4430 domain-containing protein [Hyphomicrobiales bacterium]|nr:DUF4430 domain-containing protein [Hyphomicrobiales bacterium]